MESNGRCQSRRLRHTLFALAAIALGSGGCTTQPSPGGAGGSDAAQGSAATVDGLTAEQIADRMLTAYRQAASYADGAAYVQHSVHRSEGVERDLPFFQMTLAFERPNRLRLGFEEAVKDSAANQGFNIASDGIVVRAMAGGLKGQIQEAAAPAELTLENFLPDPYLREVFDGRGVGDVFPQLAMLLNKDDKLTIFPNDEAPRLLEPKELRGRRCYRISSASPAGSRTLWIDSETYVLHRMELPIESQRRTLDPDGSYSQLAIWIDFEGATFNAAVEGSAFTMEAPQDARRVRRFVLPPPAAPPEELGRPMAEVELAALDGAVLTTKALAGKVVLLDFWQIDCAPCKAHTPALDAIYRELRADDNFACYAVNTEPPNRAANDAVQGAWESWGGTMPILRVTAPETLDRLKVAGTPTLLLLDAQGRLQYRHERQVQDAAELKQIIQRVIAGEDIAGEARAERRKLVRDFERELEAVTIRDAVIDVPLAETKIAERKEPVKAALAELWRTTKETIEHPGQLLVVSDAHDGAEQGAHRIIVLDGGRDIVELDAGGKRKSRRQLPGADAAIGGDPRQAADQRFLRSTVDAEGNQYLVVSAVGALQLHLFDGDVNHLLAFPKERNPGIADVQIAPFRETGEPRLYVGYWGGVGVQGVSLDGQRKWSERSLDQLVEIELVPTPTTAASAPDDDSTASAFELWCTSNRGTIHVLDARGKPQREVRVGRCTLMHLSAAKMGAGDDFDCCGIDLISIGQYGVVGFAPDGEIAWQFDLAPGEYTSQVERIQPVTLPGGQRAWMIAAPDGTILWIDREGKEVDRFAYGQPLSGLALTNMADAAILWVSTPEYVAAYKLTVKP